MPNPLDNLPGCWQIDGMPPPTRTELAANIRAVMGRQRVTMTELSRLTGIPRSTLTSQIDNSLTVDNLLLVADALSTTPADLIGLPA